MRLALLVVLLLATALVARADDDAALRQLLGDQMLTCRLDGGWAACDVRKDTDVELQLFRFRDGAWNRLGAGQGPLTGPMLLALGVPDATVRNFGLGIVPRRVRKSLEGAARGDGTKADSFVIVSRSTEYLARTYNAAEPGKTTIWAWTPDRWSRLFTYGPGDDVDAAFRANGVSPYMQQRLLSNPPQPLERVPLFN